MADIPTLLPEKFGSKPVPYAKIPPMDEEGNNGGESVSDGFVKGKQQQSDRTSSGSTDSVPTIFCGDLKIPLEKVEAILQPSLCAAEARVTCMMQQFVESIESKILSAVKQAAMDIIKHLGKEAAMRVLVAERKSIHFEQELTSTKQEALTLLVQLKQSMDAQIVEAERACEIERRRTKEMEEKLITLQGTVMKLKDELKRKREALEKMQKMIHPSDEHYVVEMHSPTKYSTMQVRSSPRRLPEQILITKSYMPSIIMKSKEQAIPANGYNSGICGEKTINESIADMLPMSEGNVNKECLSIEDDFAPHSLEKSHDTDVANPQSQPVMPDVNCCQKQDAGCFLRQSSVLVNYIGQIDSCDEVSVHTDGKQYASSESDASLGTKVKLMSTDRSTGKVVNVETPNDLTYHPETCDTSILPQDREAKTLGFETSKSSAGDDEPASSFMENLDVPSVEKDAGVRQPNFNMYIKEIPKDNCRTSGKHGDEVINVESTICSSYTNSSVENGGKYLETACNKVASESEVSNAIRSDEWKTTLSVDSNITKTKCDKVTVTGNSSVVDHSNKIPSQMTNIDATEGTENQIFGNAINQRASCRDTKYTFQRKRRRGSSFLQNGNLIQEEKNPKRAEIKPHEYILNSCSGKLPQKQRTTTLALQKSSVMSESPQDSRRLMLGAHQLVLLSEKKSWC